MGEKNPVKKQTKKESFRIKTQTFEHINQVDKVLKLATVVKLKADVYV